MFDWFEKVAPIRLKFKVLAGSQILLGAGGVSVLAYERASTASLITCVAIFSLMTTALVLAGRRICTPYVNTVLRMEALAAGDTQSAIQYTDFVDCVGRMTKAMAAFRDNAVEVQNARASQEKIVGALSEGLQSLSSRKLDYRITEPFAPAYDKLRLDYNEALQSLNETIEAVRASAQRVNTGASEIRAASDDLALRNEQQAASLEETAAAMNQITGIVKETASGAASVQKSISEAHLEASEGGIVVERAVAAMSEIEKGAQEITQIINVIDGIAFQTNLLALNAGVEAARAGDAGKGFAVVANEVRALAQRSADAAKDIKELITASTEQVAGGVKLVGETGELLSKIVGRVGEINTMVGEIASSTEHQAVNLQQVNSSVSEMDRMTQQNAAMVEQSTAASRSLADEASELTAMVGQFRTGSAQQGSPAPAVRTLAPSRKSAPARMPQVSGNLALAPADDDWTEF